MNITNMVKYEHSTNKKYRIYKSPSGRLWTPLAKGSFNYAFKNIDGNLVLKLQQQDKADSCDSPQRAVRLWNLINPHLTPNAELEYNTDGSVLGWVCPFIEGGQAADIDIEYALIQIFNRTGRIIADASAKNNFITTPSGQTVCIDVGMALEFEPLLALRRQVSAVSLHTWRHIRSNYHPFFKKEHPRVPHTIEAVRSLIFIQQNRPHIKCANFLLEKPLLLSIFSHAYEAQWNREHPSWALSILDEQYVQQLQETSSAPTDLMHESSRLHWI